MLAYTPVHHLLFAAGVPPLVMTSGNVSGEPIVHRDDEVEAGRRIADDFAGVLRAAVRLAERGIVEPVLVGASAEIEKTASRHAVDLGSAAVEDQDRLGPEGPVVVGFQNVAAKAVKKLQPFVQK